MEKKRQKMTNQYIRSQSSDPTLSPLKMVETVSQNMDTLPPYSEEPIQPTAPIYPELHHINHTSAISADPFHLSNIDLTLQELRIPGFGPDKP